MRPFYFLVLDIEWSCWGQEQSSPTADQRKLQHVLILAHYCLLLLLLLPKFVSGPEPLFSKAHDAWCQWEKRQRLFHVHDPLWRTCHLRWAGKQRGITGCTAINTQNQAWFLGKVIACFLTMACGYTFCSPEQSVSHWPVYRNPGLCQP